MPAFVNEEMWTIDGLPLSTWAYNIESIGGRQAIPQMRGDNLVVPYRPGEVWRSRVPQARILTLGMWIRSSDLEGITPKTAVGRRAQFNENLRTLRRLLYNRDRLLTLTKTVRFLNGLQSFTSYVECISTLDPQMTGPNFGKMVVELKMTEPYWTAGLITVPATGNNTAGFTINNPGDDSTHKMFIQVTQGVNSQPQHGVGPTIISNTSFMPALTVNLPGIQPNHYMRADVERFFLGYDGDTAINRASLVTRTGPSPFWMELKKGDNVFTISNRYGEGSFGNISVGISFYPVYL